MPREITGTLSGTHFDPLAPSADIAAHRAAIWDLAHEAARVADYAQPYWAGAERVFLSAPVGLC